MNALIHNPKLAVGNWQGCRFPVRLKEIVGFEEERAVSLKKTFFTVSNFISWQKAKSLVLTPKFQRRSVWKIGAKSFLIDTIVRNFPIPIIFLRDRRTDSNTLESPLPERAVQGASTFACRARPFYRESSELRALKRHECRAPGVLRRALIAPSPILRLPDALYFQNTFASPRGGARHSCRFNVRASGRAKTFHRPR